MEFSKALIEDLRKTHGNKKRKFGVVLNNCPKHVSSPGAT